MCLWASRTVQSSQPAYRQKQHTSNFTCFFAGVNRKKNNPHHNATKVVATFIVWIRNRSAAETTMVSMRVFQYTRPFFAENIIVLRSSQNASSCKLAGSALDESRNASKVPVLTDTLHSWFFLQTTTWSTYCSATRNEALIPENRWVPGVRGIPGDAFLAQANIIVILQLSG